MPLLSSSFLMFPPHDSSPSPHVLQSPFVHAWFPSFLHFFILASLNIRVDPTFLLPTAYKHESLQCVRFYTSSGNFKQPIFGYLFLALEDVYSYALPSIHTFFASPHCFHFLLSIHFPSSNIGLSFRSLASPSSAVLRLPSICLTFTLSPCFKRPSHVHVHDTTTPVLPPHLTCALWSLVRNHSSVFLHVLTIISRVLYTESNSASRHCCVIVCDTCCCHD